MVLNGEINEFDIIIIGGGATGAGTARDCSLRGMRVLLVERFDFAAGVSSVLWRKIISLSTTLPVLLWELSSVRYMLWDIPLTIWRLCCVPKTSNAGIQDR